MIAAGDVYIDAEISAVKIPPCTVAGVRAKIERVILPDMDDPIGGEPGELDDITMVRNFAAELRRIVRRMA